MRELKRLFFAVLVLTFIGGMGTGAWIGTLTAGTVDTAPSVDRRVDDFRMHFDLTKSQIRRLRAAIAEYDGQVKRIHSELSQAQFQSILQEQTRSRAKVRQVLTDEQKVEYDKLLKGR